MSASRRPSLPADQTSLFGPPPGLPEGFAYQRDVLSPGEEGELLARLGALTFRPFEFHGYLGKRRVASFGWRYDFNDSRLQKADEIPAFLLPLRERAALFAGLGANELQHVLLTEYASGAGIGWHRDRPEFGDVVGVSLAASCTFRFRRRERSGWQRASFTAEPRSAYLLRGSARTDWEHSIAPVDALRYSVTFRNLRG